jgi:hypothetical protein
MPPIAHKKCAHCGSRRHTRSNHCPVYRRAQNRRFCEGRRREKAREKQAADQRFAELREQFLSVDWTPYKPTNAPNH